MYGLYSEFTFSLPGAQEFRNGLAKQAYRRALSGIIPDAIRDRVRKLGFVTGEEDWLLAGSGGVFSDAFAGIPANAPYRRGYVQQVFGRFLGGKSPYDPLLWKIFNLAQLQVNGTASLAPARTSRT